MMTVSTRVTDAPRDKTRPCSVTMLVLPAVEKEAPCCEMMVPTMVPPPAALMVAKLPTCQNTFLARAPPDRVMLCGAAAPGPPPGGPRPPSGGPSPPPPAPGRRGRAGGGARRGVGAADLSRSVVGEVVAKLVDQARDLLARPMPVNVLRTGAARGAASTTAVGVSGSHGLVVGATSDGDVLAWRATSAQRQGGGRPSTE